MKIAYVQKDTFRDSTLAIIAQANRIVEEYQRQGFTLTLRQLYYQFVARGYLKNEQRNYKRLGKIVTEARLAGLLSWEAIEDRTRNLQRQPEWDDAPDVIEAAARGFRIDKWEGQPNRIEVWIEKEALAGVFERVCRRLQVPFFCCRGYTSISEMWRAANRLDRWKRDGYEPIILHFGDHDPSGIDMTRDVRDRLDTFQAWGVLVDRLALNMSQVEEHEPPPNPAKLTDSRASDYVGRFGYSSWELDALEPALLAELVEERVLHYRDEEKWEAKVQEEQYERDLLDRAVKRWGDVEELLTEEEE